jgi:hypothetical protein
MVEEKKRPSGLCLNVVCSVILIPVALYFFNNLDSIVSFITDNVMMMLALGFLAKLTSKIVFALAFVPIGTLYKLVHALIPVRASHAPFSCRGQPFPLNLRLLCRVTSVC